MIFTQSIWLSAQICSAVLMNRSDSRDDSSKEMLRPHTTWQNSLEHFVRSRKSVTRSLDQSASVEAICIVKRLLQRSAFTRVCFQSERQGDKKREWQKKEGVKECDMVRKREGTESDENKEKCLSFVNPAQVCVVAFYSCEGKLLGYCCQAIQQKARR